MDQKIRLVQMKTNAYIYIYIYKWKWKKRED